MHVRCTGGKIAGCRRNLIVVGGDENGLSALYMDCTCSGRVEEPYFMREIYSSLRAIVQVRSKHQHLTR